MKTKETSTRQQAIAWWNSLISEDVQYYMERYFYNNKLPFVSKLTGRQIEEIWLKETSERGITITDLSKQILDKPKDGKTYSLKLNQKQFQIAENSTYGADSKNHPINRKQFVEFDEEPHVFNLQNKVKFSVNDLKEFSEEFAKRVLNRGDKSDLTGFWSLCKEMFYDKFKTKSYIKKIEFDESLFKAYIDKFSDEDKLKMLQVLYFSQSKPASIKLTNAILDYTK